MRETVEFLLHHGTAVLFAFVFAEQAGLPIPSIPVLLAAGALIRTRDLRAPAALAVVLVASLVADLLWYELGRRRGHSILNLLCRISLEPDSCVRRTEDLFVRRGARALLIAKFVPGLSTVSAALGGMLGMAVGRFLLFEAGGGALYLGSFLLAGYIFSAQLETVALLALRLGVWLAVLLAGGLAAYVILKYRERRRFIRDLRIARITPEELKRKIDTGEDVVVVDLRHSVEFEAADSKIAGALHLLPGELEQRAQEIPRDRDVVLYCT
jgi:membrane protein DedA with SNARE-associated domain